MQDVSLKLSQSTYERLERHARPFVDTVDMVVNRALDALERREDPLVPGGDPPERRVDPRNLPDLTHTKILVATLKGDRSAKRSWKDLLGRILIRAMKQCGTFDELRQLCPDVNMVQGRKEDEGYSYLDEVDFSIQGLPTNNACRALVGVAERLGIELEITFQWRSKEGAAYPGEMARLTVPGALQD